MRFRVLNDPVTSFLFRTRFEIIFLSSSARGLEQFHSSFTRGSKMILVKWYFYPPLHEVLKLIFVYRYFCPLPHEVLTFCWKIILLPSFARGSKLIFKWKTCSLDWTYTWLLDLVLFRSYTWRPVKLGSVSALHLKANQTWFWILPYVHLPGLTLDC